MTLFQQSTLEEESRAQRSDRIDGEHVVAAGAAGLPTAVVDELAAESSGAVVGLADTSVYGNFELDPYAAKVVVGRLARGPARPRGHARFARPAGQGRGGALGGRRRRARTPRWANRCDSVSATARVHEPPVVAVYEKSLGFADVRAAVGRSRGRT